MFLLITPPPYLQLAQKRVFKYSTQKNLLKLFLKVIHLFILTYISFTDMNGGIAMIEMLNSSNIIALVGGGNLPKYSPTKVIIYDIKLHKEVAILRFGTNIKNIKLCNDK